MAQLDRPAHIDLHLHSPAGGDYRGDPSTSPEQIVSACAKAGLDLAVVADHMTVDAWETFAPLSGDGIGTPCLLPGAEIKVHFGSGELHLVAILDPIDANNQFATLLGALLPFVKKNGSLSTTEIGADPGFVAGMIQASGGLCVAAHMDRFAGLPGFAESWERALELAESHLIDAIEFDDIEKATALPGMVRVPSITSSDAHSLEEIGRRHTQIRMREISFAGLRSALLMGQGSIIDAPQPIRAANAR